MTTPITQAFQNGYHLEKKGDGLTAVKDRNGCCFSKILPAQTQKEREAIASLAERFISSGECDPSLYPAVNKRYRQIDCMISGFINWIKAIFFRSRAYNRELKLLRQELQNFRAQFSRNDVINSIRNKIFSMEESQPKDDSKIFKELLKEFPEVIINNKEKRKDFNKTPIFIEKKELGYYSVYFPPYRPSKRPKEYFTDSLNCLLHLEKMYCARQLYKEVKHRHFEEADRLKGELSLSFAPTTYSLTVTYFLPTKGDCKATLDLSTFHSKKELDQELDKYKNASSKSFQKIQSELAELNQRFTPFSVTYSGLKRSYLVQKQNEPEIKFEILRPFVEKIDQDEFSVQLSEKIRDILNEQLQKAENFLYKLKYNYKHPYNDLYGGFINNYSARKKILETQINEIKNKITRFDEFIKEGHSILKEKLAQLKNPEESIKASYRLDDSVKVKLIFSDLKTKKLTIKKILFHTHSDRFDPTQGDLAKYGILTLTHASEVYNLMATYRKGDDQVLLQLVEELTAESTKI